MDKTYYYASPEVIGAVQYHSRAFRIKDLDLHMEFTTFWLWDLGERGSCLRPMLWRALLQLHSSPWTRSSILSEYLGPWNSLSCHFQACSSKAGPRLEESPRDGFWEGYDVVLMRRLGCTHLYEPFCGVGCSRWEENGVQVSGQKPVLPAVPCFG